MQIDIMYNLLLVFPIPILIFHQMPKDPVAVPIPILFLPHPKAH